MERSVGASEVVGKAIADEAFLSGVEDVGLGWSWG